MPGPFVSPVPVAASQATWQVYDYLEAAVSGPIGANGSLQLVFDPVPDQALWQVTRAVVSCTGTGTVAPTVLLYVDDVDQRSLRSGSSAGFFDEADYPGDGMQVPANSRLIAQWTAAPPGAIATVEVQYRLLRRGGG